jgi:hypothetical protein
VTIQRLVAILGSVLALTSLVIYGIAARADSKMQDEIWSCPIRPDRPRAGNCA